jgi:hypothetical protein
MVPAIDQADMPSGSLRFLMSLRATGEGHISSIVFRGGVVDANGRVSVDLPGRYSRVVKAIAPDTFEKGYFVRELHALGAWSDHAQATLALLGDRFTRAQLSDAIDEVRTKASVSGQSEESNDALLSLTEANYRLNQSPGADISELVIFPFSHHERRGIEDMRLVRFTGDDGSSHYYGTYTAYDGSFILPHLIETKDFLHFKMSPLHGKSAINKNLALFPRKINGQYAMISRIDGVNNYIMFSDDLYLWETAILLQKPKYPWEFIQIGNAGSPVETGTEHRRRAGPQG